jgi:hypothetical protein
MAWADKAFEDGVDVIVLAPEQERIQTIKRNARIVTIIDFFIFLPVFAFSFPLFLQHAAFGWLLLLQLPHLFFTQLAVLLSSRAFTSTTICISLVILSVALLADTTSAVIRIVFLASCHLSCSSDVVYAFSVVVLVLVCLLVAVDIHQLASLFLMYTTLESRAKAALAQYDRIMSGLPCDVLLQIRRSNTEQTLYATTTTTTTTNTDSSETEEVEQQQFLPGRAQKKKKRKKKWQNKKSSNQYTLNYE